MALRLRTLTCRRRFLAFFVVRPLRRADQRPALFSAAIRLTAFSYDRCPVACLAFRAGSGQMLSLLSPGSAEDLAFRNLSSSGANAHGQRHQAQPHYRLNESLALRTASASATEALFHSVIALRRQFPLRSAFFPQLLLENQTPGRAIKVQLQKCTESDSKEGPALLPAQTSALVKSCSEALEEYAQIHVIFWYGYPRELGW